MDRRKLATEATCKALGENNLGKFMLARQIKNSARNLTSASVGPKVGVTERQRQTGYVVRVYDIDKSTTHVCEICTRHSNKL